MKNSADQGGCYPPRPKAAAGYGEFSMRGVLTNQEREMF